MAPELIKTDDKGKSDLSIDTLGVFTLGMVAFVSSAYNGWLFHGLETLSCASFQISTIISMMCLYEMYKIKIVYTSQI